MRNLHLIILVSILSLIGIAIFLYKTLALNFPLQPNSKTTIWNIEAKLQFTANGPVTVGLFIPYKNKQFLNMNENFISRGYGISTRKIGMNRQARWTIRRSKGKQILYYQSVVRQQKKENILEKTPPLEQVYHAFEGAYRESAEALLNEIRAKSADTESFILELMLRLSQPTTIKSLLNLSSTVLSDEDHLNLAVRVLSLAGITSRSVHGIRLEDQRKEAFIVHWLEYYDRETWNVFNPATGGSELPNNYMGWWKGPEPLFFAKGANDINAFVSVTPNQEAALNSAIELGKIKQPFLLAFSLFSLPLQTQAVYRILLLIPLGIAILIILRNMIGLKTFGTFMPVLIGLAFRETQLLLGILMFILLVSAGMSIRLYMEHLKLLVIPRLAAVLIVVIILMIGSSILMHQLGLERGLSVALFPMVILTMTIERAAIVWEEMGAFETFVQAAGTIIAAAAAYMIMSIHYLEHLIFIFPELLIVLLAFTLLMGRYTGYRLLELIRFKSLMGN